MSSPHGFRPIAPGSNRCKLCGGWLDHPCHSFELFTDADHSREAARLVMERDEMTAKMLQPLKDVSRAAGILERESPLFFGTGHNPPLF